MYKQVVIARKDLAMSPGKLSAQTGHGFQAYFTSLIKDQRNTFPITKGMLTRWGDEIPPDWQDVVGYEFDYIFDKDLHEQWICGSFTKTVLEAKNKYQLLKAKTMAEEMGLKEGEDFFLIKDNCLTELEPEEVDENGVGRTLTCIGFRPMDSEVIDKIGKKYQLYK